MHVTITLTTTTEVGPKTVNYLALLGGGAGATASYTDAVGLRSCWAWRQRSSM